MYVDNTGYCLLGSHILKAKGISKKPGDIIHYTLPA